jgi:quinol monooxygenase YgiN
MSQDTVSIHPYFKVHPGKLEAARALYPKFIAQTSKEPKCLYYEFTNNGDIIFCREAYVGAEGVLAHLASVGEVLAEMLTVSDVLRLEIHGSAAELEKLKAPLADYKPEWFVYEAGLDK